MLGIGEARQVCVKGGGFRTTVTKIDLYLTQVLTLFKQMGGVAMAQSVNAGLFFYSTGLDCQPKDPLQCRATHWPIC